MPQSVASLPFASQQADAYGAAGQSVASEAYRHVATGGALPRMPYAPVRCDDHHSKIQALAEPILTGLKKKYKVLGRTLAVAGGLGAGAGAGVVVAAALHATALAAVSSTLMFPPVIVALVALPIVGAVLAGTLIRWGGRAHFKKNPQTRAAIAELQNLQRAFLTQKARGPLSPGDQDVLSHVTAVLGRFEKVGIGGDLGRLGLLSLVTGALSGLIAAAIVAMVAVDGGGGDMGCSGSQGGFFGPPVYWGYHPLYLWDTPTFATGRGHRTYEQKLQLRKLNAAQGSAVIPEDIAPLS